MGWCRTLPGGLVYAKEHPPDLGPLGAPQVLVRGRLDTSRLPCSPSPLSRQSRPAHNLTERLPGRLRSRRAYRFYDRQRNGRVFPPLRHASVSAPARMLWGSGLPLSRRYSRVVIPLHTLETTLGPWVPSAASQGCCLHPVCVSDSVLSEGLRSRSPLREDVGKDGAPGEAALGSRTGFLPTSPARAPSIRQGRTRTCAASRQRVLCH